LRRFQQKSQRAGDQLVGNDVVVLVKVLDDVSQSRLEISRISKRPASWSTWVTPFVHAGDELHEPSGEFVWIHGQLAVADSTR
jgi:hypothetical protein